MQVRSALTQAAALFSMLLFSAAIWAQQPVTGYAPVNGLKMYYEIHGKGRPVVLLHGSFMTIPSNWQEMIAALSKTRQVIAVEMQGHGRTADIAREFSYALQTTCQRCSTISRLRRPTSLATAWAPASR